MSGRANSRQAARANSWKSLIVDLLEGGADDVDVGEQPGVGEPEEPGKEFAAGQVTGGPEEDDHMGR